MAVDQSDCKSYNKYIHAPTHDRWTGVYVQEEPVLATPTALSPRDIISGYRVTKKVCSYMHIGL